MFSRRIELALDAAIRAHEGQHRKSGEEVPYAVHPLHVALMLARWDMEEDVIVAGLLHDVVEDCEDWSAERVEQEFGSHVASIVSELTEDKGQGWETRKRTAIEAVPGLTPQAASVRAVDILHNLRSLEASLRGADSDPAAVWARFRGGRERTLEDAREMVAVLQTRIDPRLGRALQAAIDAVLELEGLPVGQPAEPGSAPRPSEA